MGGLIRVMIDSYTELNTKIQAKDGVSPYSQGYSCTDCSSRACYACFYEKVREFVYDITSQRNYGFFSSSPYSRTFDNIEKRVNDLYLDKKSALNPGQLAFEETGCKKDSGPLDDKGIEFNQLN